MKNVRKSWRRGGGGTLNGVTEGDANGLGILLSITNDASYRSVSNGLDNSAH